MIDLSGQEKVVDPKSDAVVSFSDIKDLAGRFTAIHDKAIKYKEKFPGKKSEGVVRLAETACMKFYNEVLDPCHKLQIEVEKARLALEGSEKGVGAFKEVLNEQD